MRCAHANFFDQVADVLGKDVCELTGMLDLLCGSYTGVNELMRNIQRSFALLLHQSGLWRRPRVPTHNRRPLLQAPYSN